MSVRLVVWCNEPRNAEGLRTVTKPFIYDKPHGDITLARMYFHANFNTVVHNGQIQSETGGILAPLTDEHEIPDDLSILL